MTRITLVSSALLFLLVACQHEPTGGAGGAFCDGNKPYRLAGAEIDAAAPDTLRQMAAYNRRGKRECGWRE